MKVRISPLKMTAEECHRRLEAERRSRNCLPQDIEYWQFYIDFHTHGQAYAESRQRGSATDHFPANDQISYPKITIADFDLDIPHSLPFAPPPVADSPARFLPFVQGTPSQVQL